MTMIAELFANTEMKENTENQIISESSKCLQFVDAQHRLKQISAMVQVIKCVIKMFS